MELKKFDKPTLQLLRKEIDAALLPVKEKYGLEKLHGGSISFQEFSFTIKVEAALEVPEKESKQQNETFSKLLGFNQNIVGEMFTHSNRRFKVSRIDLKKRQFPIIATGNDGKSYKFKMDGPKFENTDIKGW